MGCEALLWGTILLACSCGPGPPRVGAAPLSTATYVLDDGNGLGREFDGIGAVSGGGVSGCPGLRCWYPPRRGKGLLGWASRQWERVVPSAGPGPGVSLRGAPRTSGVWGHPHDVSGARRRKPGGAEGSYAGSGPAAGDMEPAPLCASPPATAQRLLGLPRASRVLGAGGGELSQGGFLCRES